MLVFVVAGVVTDRGIANRTIPDPGTFVPAYRSFQEFLAGQKLRQVDDHRGFPDVFLGNSRTLFGVDPATFDAQASARGIDTRSYNLAMPTIDARFWPLFFEQYYGKRAPKRVMYGISARDVAADNDTAAAYQAAFRASPGFQNRDRTDIWKWSEELLAQLYTLRGRVEETSRFNRPDFFRLSGQRDRLRQYTISGSRGFSPFPARYTKPASVLRRERDRGADRYAGKRLLPGRDRVEALEELYRWTRAHGGCLTFFSLPVLYDHDPWGGEAVRRDFVRFMGEFVRTHEGTQFVNVGEEGRARYAVTDYGDGDHLNASGARRFSRDLADSLAPTLPRDCS
ncbi:MAG: hypothetical protein WKF48_02175 [Solirubrobacteraceae bacterium]